MYIAAPWPSPSRDKAWRHYDKAYKNWIQALYDSRVLGKDPWVWVRVTETLSSHRGFAYEWGETKWITGADYNANYKKYNWCVDSTISRYDLAYYFLCGWARKANREIPPKRP